MLNFVTHPFISISLSVVFFSRWVVVSLKQFKSIRRNPPPPRLRPPKDQTFIHGFSSGNGHFQRGQHKHQHQHQHHGGQHHHQQSQQQHSSCGSSSFLIFITILLHSQPIREPEAPGLEHLWAVPEKSQAPIVPLSLQWRPRLGISSLPGPIREDQSPHPNVPLLRPPKPTCSLSMPSPPSLGQPRRPHRPPSSRLRRARRQAWGQPLWSSCCETVLTWGQRLSGQSKGNQLWEEEAQAPSSAASSIATSNHELAMCDHQAVWFCSDFCHGWSKLFAWEVCWKNNLIKST